MPYGGLDQDLTHILLRKPFRLLLHKREVWKTIKHRPIDANDSEHLAVFGLNACVWSCACCNRSSPSPQLNGYSSKPAQSANIGSDAESNF
jgi:hypothetical protein